MITDSNLRPCILLTPSANKCFNTFKPAQMKKESKKQAEGQWSEKKGMQQSSAHKTDLVIDYLCSYS